jgi:hypothetical protein
MVLGEADHMVGGGLELAAVFEDIGGAVDIVAFAIDASKSLPACIRSRAAEAAS